MIAKLGPPSSDRWRKHSTGLQFHLLRYPRRALTIVLLGEDRSNPHYAGTIDRAGRVIHSVTLPGGEDSGEFFRRSF